MGGARIYESEGTPLNEYDEDEWFSVCKIVRPDITREEFKVLWDSFQTEKEERQRKRMMN